MSVSLPSRASMDMRQRVRERIASGRARVGVIGLGYVGLPLAMAAANGGYEVVGIDTDPSKVSHLNAGHSYLDYIPDAQIVQVRESGRFTASGDFAHISDLDVITICVPPRSRRTASQISPSSPIPPT